MDADPAPIDVEIVRPQGAGPLEMQPGSVEEARDQAGIPVHASAHGAHLLPREHHRNAPRLPGSHPLLEPEEVRFEDLASEAQERREGLVCGRSAYPSADGDLGRGEVRHPKRIGSPRRWSC